VPYTRGRERSRDAHSILNEVKELVANGYKEVNLLGQNVDSYKWSSEEANEQVNFAQLLERVALVATDLRVRFSTSHPKDITDEVLYTMKKYDNICNSIHLPAQSGNTRILELMNRTYTREWYMERITKIREILGDDCGISSDTIAGFCTETEEEHQDTLSLIEFARFDFGYQFVYSERPGTPAAKKLPDDVPEDVKQRRLTEIIAMQRQLSLEHNQAQIGTVQKILIEGVSKKSDNDLKGRNSRNMMAIFPKKHYTKGQYVDVLITGCSGGTLFGEIVEKVQST